MRLLLGYMRASFSDELFGAPNLSVRLCKLCEPSKAWAETEGGLLRAAAAYCMERFQRHSKSRLAYVVGLCRCQLGLHAFRSLWFPLWCMC